MPLTVPSFLMMVLTPPVVPSLRLFLRSGLQMVQAASLVVEHMEKMTGRVVFVT